MTDFRKVDNMINRINKKVDRIRIDLSTRSSLYGRAASIITSHMQRYGLVKRDGGKYGIKRGNAIKQMSQKQLDSLAEELKRIEIELNQRSLTDEKKALRGIIQNLKGKKDIGRVSIRDYRKAEKLQRAIGHTYGNAIDYFYNEVDDSAPEKQEAQRIMYITGRRKTYEEMRRLVELANQHLNRTQATNPIRREDMGYKYGIRDMDIEQYFNWR
jgi:hypothetical protein